MSKEATAEKKHKREVEHSFWQGFAVAIGILAREHGEPTVAFDILRGAGGSLELLKKCKVESYDLKAIRKGKP